MATKKVYELTQDGLKNLKNELTNLIEVKRPENVLALKEAREHGDLSENADYDAARNEQARIEARIKEINYIIKNVKMIRENSNDNIINIGKTVEIELNPEDDESNVKKFTYTLVGSLEANPLKNKISINSPIGKAISGKSIDEALGKSINFKTETGKKYVVKILKIS